MYGIPGRNRGVIGSCAVRLFERNAAATGLNERAARAANIPCDSVYTMSMDKVGLMPGSAPMHFKLVFEVPTGRILGAQAVGKGNVAVSYTHLDRHYKGAEKLGHGAGYKYAHDYPKHYVKQQYLPDGMEGAVFYKPSDNGYEASIKTHMNWLTN